MTVVPVVEDLLGALGADAVAVDASSIVRVLRDNSWLSPSHTREFDSMRERLGPTLGVVAVVSPTSTEDIQTVAAIAVGHRTPVTPRGSGTSNFGLITPERGGILLDLRGIKHVCRLDGDVVVASAGVLQGAMERKARERGRELTVLTTTFASATVGGWVAGGHVGLGSSMFGSVWDGNIKRVQAITMEPEPRQITLEGHDAIPLLHTFGTVAIITEVVMPTDEAHDWLEAVAWFDDFYTASYAVRDLSVDRHFRHRVVTAQEPELMPAFRVLEPIRRPGAGVLMIVDKLQATDVCDVVLRHGGSFVPWQASTSTAGRRPSIAGMVYGHRMLWVKKRFPHAAFLHVYFDPDDPERDVRTLKARFGGRVLIEMKYIRSPMMLATLGHAVESTLPASVVTIVDGASDGSVEEVMETCDATGIAYQNPHTSVIEDNGMMPDIDSVVRLKSQFDPFNLLNPGRLRSADVQKI